MTLKCPLCERDVKCVPDEYGSGGQHVPPHHIWCRECGLSLTMEDSEDAVAAWARLASARETLSRVKFDYEETRDLRPSTLAMIETCLLSRNQEHTADRRPSK